MFWLRSCWILVILVVPLRVTQAAQPEPRHPQSVIPEPISDEDSGFKTLFDGKTFKDWDGDPAYWRIENKVIVGETKAENSPKHSSFLIWRSGTPADSELKLEYRISGMGNSGVQYRSVEVPGTKWALRGYQADIDGAQWGKMLFEGIARERGWDIKRVTGQNYDEGGSRAFLALLGQISYVSTREKRMLASLGDGETLARILGDDWNRLHLIVRGNQMIHIVNGRALSIVIDDDTAHRRMEGLLGMQIHPGPPSKVEFRNIRLKEL